MSWELRNEICYMETAFPCTISLLYDLYIPVHAVHTKPNEQPNLKIRSRHVKVRREEKVTDPPINTQKI